ncbi:hypothetical protein MMC08_003795 [Hypocenomyce scalaris]|nr:hypothetical protein [Hypocenomyce scalaris]
MGVRALEIPYSPNPIQCTLALPEITSKEKSSKGTKSTPALIFTHGAGGTLSSDAIANFSSGFSIHAGLLCFQGNMNLKSRVKMFNSVIEDQSFSICLGGRSMGARAAVMAASDATERLVLISYPLCTGKETRDAVLLELTPAVKVIFIVGSRDSMCDLGQLEEVRKKMKAKSWRVVVEEADHGMNVKPKKGTEAVGKLTGEVVAKWIDECDGETMEGRITWNEEAERAEWSGWSVESADAVNPPLRKKETSKQQPDNSALAPTPEKTTKRSKLTREKPPDVDVASGRTRKRVKR